MNSLATDATVDVSLTYDPYTQRWSVSRSDQAEQVAEQLEAAKI